MKKTIAQIAGASPVSKSAQRSITGGAPPGRRYLCSNLKCYVCATSLATCQAVCLTGTCTAVIACPLCAPV
jgi:hypothetical protein